MKKRILSLVLVLAMSVGMMACGSKGELVDPTPTTAPDTSGDTTPSTGGDTTTPDATPTTAPVTGGEVDTPVMPSETLENKLEYAEGTVLRMATGYNSAKTGMFFDAETAGEGVTLADGKTYQAGDLKPTWVAVQDKLGIVFENKYQGNSAANEYKYWKEQLDQVDVVSGNATGLSEAGVAGEVVNLAEYLDDMPNFKAYLEANPIVRLSITGDTDTGAIYFSPYFDGVNDIERMPLMRTDWVEKLLNGEGAFTASASNNLNAAAYTPYMPTSGKVAIDVVKKDGSAVESINKDYDAAGNIVALMNEKGSMTGVEAVNMLRTYIDTAYNGYYGTTRSNLFIGQNAAWDADEMVALLRCVVANAQTLNGTDTIQGLFSREDNNNQRRVDLFRFAGVLFGVRGLESRQDYLYVGSDGKLHDARQEPEAYAAMEKMNAMVQEGLISKSFVDNSKESSATMLENDMGFMSYDYNQTQTILNETKLQAENGEKYMAVMVPVARWNDGTGEQYMRFTESWRSVKTDGWGISVAGVAGDENKLNAALALIDYAYSPEGQILMSYGPSAFIKEGETFNFNGKEMPVIADATYAELWEKASGNYTNYARYYLGSTLSFVKSQAFEYQCTHEVGKEGAGYISNAIGLGVIKHPELAITENPWYISAPAVLPTTASENDEIAGLTELRTSYSSAKGEDQVNYFVDQIAGGYVHDGMGSAEEAAEYAVNTMNGKLYLYYKQGAYERLLDYYASIS